ncbi:MAG: type I DNA topoisomerase, partial [Candidatus Aminicenantes bacterium]|nr:type I DNA topoisomerase [Candidatus Aminicenantes bacterium]
MPRSLVIVESPAKAKTINRYLGDEYIVRPSMGHVRDLPKSSLGVDVENDFTPKYIVIPDRRKLVTELKKTAAECEEVVLAADPDREGEAICWHLRDLLKDANANIHRVLLHEITRKAVVEAFENKLELNVEKFRAQQTRRILDRLVGYLVSPLLWKKVGRGLSAGRVQSIALRIICDREKEIKAFVPEEYWSITAGLRASGPPDFKAALVKIDGKKARIPDGETAGGLVERLRHTPFVLNEVIVRKKKKEPPPPHITSSLQQEAFRVHRYPVKRTMFLAQRLYEGLEIGDRGLVGLITYMRTDSFRVSDEAVSWARGYIASRWSQDFLPEAPRVFKSKKKTQDAHEAIRPTSPELSPEVVKPYLKREELNVYRLVWNRFIASQMSEAQVEETEFDIRADACQFSAKGEVILHPGFLALYEDQRREKAKAEEEDRDEENADNAPAAPAAKTLPKAVQGETLTLLDLESKQNFTQPPPRFTEGTLVKELEAKGIGRPSTYAPIIATIQNRVYVVKEEGKFIPTELGLFVTDYLSQHFSDLMDVQFTARMEEELDRISEGEYSWLESLKSYYLRLRADLDKGLEAEGVTKTGIPVEENCPECGKPLVIKSGRFGRFKACSGYPDCQFKQSLVKKEVVPLEEKCPQCGSHLVQRRGRYGLFVACSDYPKCDFVKKKEKVDTGIPCPAGCGGTLLQRKTRRGRMFYGCALFPKCRF